MTNKQKYNKRYMARWRKRNKRKILLYKKKKYAELKLLNNSKYKALLKKLKSYRQLNKETVSATKARWYKKNKKRCAAKIKARYSKNKTLRTAALARARRWAKRHKEKVKEAKRRWRDKNPEKQRQAIESWRKKNPLMVQVHKHNRSRRLLTGKDKISAEDVAIKIEDQLGKCFYCASDLFKFEIDHKTPLSVGGRHAPGNIAIACQPCNRRKGSKTVPEFIAYAKLVGYKLVINDNTHPTGINRSKARTPKAS